MKNENLRHTDKELESLVIGMLREGSAPNTYRSGFQEAASIVMCINGGDLETKKRVSRLLMNVATRIQTAFERKYKKPPGWLVKEEFKAMEEQKQAKDDKRPRSTVPEDFVTGGTWTEVGRKD
jgi:hypothetical protein